MVALSIDLAEKAESVSLSLGDSAVVEESRGSFATSIAMNGYELVISAGLRLTEIPPRAVRGVFKMGKIRCKYGWMT